MVRDVRARIFDESAASTANNNETSPVKVDVETLYILEQKSNKNTPHSSMLNIHLADSDKNRSPIRNRQDFAMQTVPSSPTNKPVHRPIGIQVNSSVRQNTVAAQTTDSLHRPMRERQRLPSPNQRNPSDNAPTITTKFELNRRLSERTKSQDDVLDRPALNGTSMLDLCHE
jgi:hypothetical protein